MKKNAFIFHGWGSNSKSHWHQWLNKELEKLGYDVFVPDFPNTKNPIQSEWVNHALSYKKHINKKTIIIGHSLGCILTCRLFENLSEKYKVDTCYMIGGFTKETSEKYQPIQNFFNNKIDWEKIKSMANSFICFGSNNDSYVSLDDLKLFNKKIGGRFIFYKDYGHFTTGHDQRFTKFPELLDLITKTS